MNSDTSPTSALWWRGQEDVVISGVSGRFAQADDVNELAAHLFAGHDLITEDKQGRQVIQNNGLVIQFQTMSGYI